MARGYVERRWFPTGAPQTLQVAVALLYFNAALTLILGVSALWPLLFMVADAAGAYGVANYYKWGYIVALVAAIGPLALLIAAHALLAAGLITLAFQIALIALLLHPQSRHYYKIWFR